MWIFSLLNVFVIQLGYHPSVMLIKNLVVGPAA